MAESYMDILKREFTADEGTFMLRVRTDFTWDKDVFSRMVQAMEACCKAYEGQESVERWVANGFWFLSSVVKSWTEHPSFPRPPGTYYKAAVQRLDDLAYWFFMGQCPYEAGRLPDLPDA